MLKPYLHLMRWHRPVGAILLAFPGLWGLLIAHHGTPPMRLIVVFLLGAWLTRSMGCVINDLCDRDIDPHVKRTAMRPLATGVVPVPHAYGLIAGLGVCAALLLFTLNALTIKLGICALGLMSLYPRCKRFFAAPQLVLGLTFAWPFLMACTASHYPIDGHAWCVYAACVCWIVGYDTLYAISDQEDDAKLKVHSLPLTVGPYAWHVSAFAYALMAALLMLWRSQNPLRLHDALGLLWLMIPIVWFLTLRQHPNHQRVFEHNQWWGAGLTLWFWASTYPA